MEVVGGFSMVAVAYTLSSPRRIPSRERQWRAPSRSSGVRTLAVGRINSGTCASDVAGRRCIVVIVDTGAEGMCIVVVAVDVGD